MEEKMNYNSSDKLYCYIVNCVKLIITQVNSEVEVLRIHKLNNKSK